MTTLVIVHYLRFDLWNAKQIADAALIRGFINAENWVDGYPQKI
jgi:hypothetical protein